MQGESKAASPGAARIEAVEPHALEGLAWPEYHAAADVTFPDDSRLPAGTNKGRLVISRHSGQTRASLTIGHLLLTGQGDFVRGDAAATLQIALLGHGGPIEAMSLSAPVTAGSARGTFACATAAALFGRAFDIFWWKNGDPFANCGAELGRHQIRVSDPENTNVSEFVLWRFERCDFIIWIKDGRLDKGSLTRLDRDSTNGQPYQRGGVTITTGKRPLAGAPVGTDHRSGALRVFCVTGCTNPRVTQYVTSSKVYTPPPNNPNAPMPQGDSRPWHVDQADPYPGAAVDAASGTVVSSDIPAVYESVMEQIDAQNPVPAGTTITYSWTLETFFRCDGVLIGWVKWGLRVVFTKDANGKFTRGAPHVDPPLFHGPGDPSESAGNPAH